MTQFRRPIHNIQAGGQNGLHNGGETPRMGEIVYDDAGLIKVGDGATPYDTLIPAGGLPMGRATPTLVAAGDSRISNGLLDQRPIMTTYQYTVTNALYSLAQGRLFHDIYNGIFATAGFTTQNWIDTHLANCAAYCRLNPGAIVVVHLGTNDFGSGAAIALTKANVITIITALNAAGASVKWLTETPRSGASVLSAQNERRRNQFNRWLLALRHTNPLLNVQAINVLPNFTNYASGAARTGYQIDGLHDTQIGGFSKGADVLAAISFQLPPFNSYFVNVSDTYDVTDNPYGNRLTNGLMAGTTGTVTAPATGTAPTSWTLATRNSGNTAAGANLSCAGSSVAHPTLNGLTLFQAVLGGTAGTGEFVVLGQNLGNNLTNYAVGDKIRLRVYVEWDAGITSVMGAQVFFNIGGTSFIYGNAGVNGNGPLPPTAMQEMVELVTVLQPGFNNNLAIELRLQADSTTAAVAGTIRMGLAEVCKID